MLVRLLAIVRLALTRLRSRLGLSILSLVGVILGVALATSVPIFSQGVSYLVLREELTSLSQLATHPTFCLRFYYVPTSGQTFTLDQAQDMATLLADLVPREVSLPLTRIVTTVQSRRVTLLPHDSGTSTSTNNSGLSKEVVFVVMTDVGEHITTVDGLPLGELPDDIGDALPVWIYEDIANSTGLNAGDTFSLRDRASYVKQTVGQVFTAYVAGIWRPTNSADPYWYENPTASLNSVMLVTPETWTSRIAAGEDAGCSWATWYLVLDDGALNIEHASSVATGLTRVGNTIGSYLAGIKLDYSPLTPLTRYLQRKATLSVLLTGFSLPSMGLLLYFLWLISSVTAQFQGGETAILASRGASRAFVLGLSACEAAVLILLGAPAGMAAGYGLARLMGNSMSFLTFVKRAPLPVYWLSFDWRILAGALLMLLLARLVPTYLAAHESIATHGPHRSRPLLKGRTSLLLVDIVLIAVSVYAYVQLKHRGTLGIIGWEPSGNPFQDPLLLLSPSLFVATAALLISQIFPFLARPIDKLSSRSRSLPLYMGVLNLARQGGQYAGALFLVIACLSLGAFYSSMASSLDGWLAESVYYQVGADFSFTHGISIETLYNTSQGISTSSGGSWLLPASDYLSIPGVEQAARVGSFTATPSLQNAATGRLMGVDRLDFPLVAFWRDEFADVPLGELMNRLGMYDDGVLVSQAFLKANAMEEGQRLELGLRVDSTTQKIAFRIVGTFNSFPTASTAGEEVFVSNLEYVFEQLGDVQRHSVWMRLAPDADSSIILSSLKDMDIEVASDSDSRLLVSENADSVERIGLFGVLSIGFLAGSVLSCIGLLVYTYAALLNRVQRLSLLRAIGARTSEVIGMVAVEYAGVNVYGVLAGLVIGVISSCLFVPFFQFSVDSSLTLPPFSTQIAWDKIAWIAAVFAGALALAQMVILFKVTRRDIFQQLRGAQRE